jgi:hypothetical protein
LGKSLISWSSRKQSFVAISTVEAEYGAAASCCSQILWTVATLQDYGVHLENVPLFCDNNSAICIAKNHVRHCRTKHIDIRFHFLRDHVEKRNAAPLYVNTEHQLAGIFTKPLDFSHFAYLRGELGVIHPTGLF